MATALGIAVFFELLWLDFFPAGTYIPPNRLMAAFLCLSLSHILGLSMPGDVLLLLVLGLPAAWLGTALETRQRVRENASYNEAMQWVRGDTRAFKPGVLILKCLLRSFFLQGGAFMLLGLLCLWLVPAVVPFWPLGGPGLGWPHLWAAALLGGILSLRIKTAYGVLLGGAAAVVLVLWFTNLFQAGG